METLTAMIVINMENKLAKNHGRSLLEVTKNKLRS